MTPAAEFGQAAAWLIIAVAGVAAIAVTSWLVTDWVEVRRRRRILAELDRRYPTTPPSTGPRRNRSGGAS